MSLLKTVILTTVCGYVLCFLKILGGSLSTGVLKMDCQNGWMKLVEQIPLSEVDSEIDLWCDPTINRQ